MSFSALMVLFVVVSGLIWLVDHFIWAPQRGDNIKEPIVVEYARSFFPIILLVLVIRSFIAEPFRIPSSSMVPTLHIGDFILVNKFSYGIRLPVIHTKIFDVGTPERGDVAVFRFPQNPKIDYIKRVVGLPGDKIGYFDKTIYINGQKIKQQRITKDARHLTIAPARTELKAETIGKHEFQVLVDPMRNLSGGEYVVPEGSYFVMGDNRDNSNDSRFWGTVAEENLVGKAFFIWMSWSWNEGGIVWQRIGNGID